MNAVDIFLIIVILLAAWSGWQKGFIIGALDLVMLVGSFLITLFIYPFVHNLFAKYIPSLGIWSMPIAFIVTIAVIRTLFSIVTGRMITAAPAKAHVNVVNKALGIFPGIVNGVIYAIIFSALLHALPLFDKLSDNTRESQLAARLTEPAEWLESKLAPVFDESVKRSMNKLTVEPESNKFISLPYTTKNSKTREDLAKQMLDLVNEERRKAGLKALKADPEMAQVALAHSKDMFARGFFSHITPEGKDPFDRMRKAGVRFIAAGENLALAQTLSIAHKGLMNSPGHRANILQRSFGRVGIGILDGGIYGLMITQNFRN